MRFQILSDRSPADVFATVADFSRIDEWDPFVSRSELVEGDSLRVGSRYRLTAPGGLTLEYEVEQVSVPDRIVYRGGTARVTSTDTISVLPRGGTSEVTVESVISFSGWTVLISPFIWVAVWLAGRFLSLPSMKRRLGS